MHYTHLTLNTSKCSCGCIYDLVHFLTPSSPKSVRLKLKRKVSLFIESYSRVITQYRHSGRHECMIRSSCRKTYSLLILHNCFRLEFGHVYFYLRLRPFRTVIWYGTVWYGTVLYGVVWCSMVFKVWYGI